MSTHNICFRGEIRKISAEALLMITQMFSWRNKKNISRGASNEYPQHMFSWRNKKNINTFWLTKKAYLKL